MDENALPNEVIIHTAQLLSYLRMGKLKLGLLIDFNVAQLRNGIKRVVNQLQFSLRFCVFAAVISI